VRPHGGQAVEGGRQRLAHKFQAVEGANPGQDLGRVGSLLGAGLGQAVGLAGLEHRLRQQALGEAHDLTGAELAEDREVEAGIGQLQPGDILPADAATDHVGGLAIGEALGEL
jgi:hypothetical protein